MTPATIDDLRKKFTDQYVAVVKNRPELARFQHVIGQVKTINMNGRALVQFDGDGNRGWFDIPLEHLIPVEKPAEPEKPKAAKPAAKPSPAKS